MTTVLFPGQGAQFVGMGKDLFNQFPTYINATDSILGYSFEELCLKDTENRLNHTAFTQPALFVINHLHYLKLIEERKKKPDFVAGHSLGEFNALCAAGVFDFETGLSIVKKRGELMAQIENGGMAAIIGIKEDEIMQALRDCDIHNIDIANYNSPNQIVISGDLEEINKLEKYFERNSKVTFLKLRVSGAFHSRFMNQVSDEFASYISKYSFDNFEIPVISNYTGKPYNNQNIKANIIKQLSNPVHWVHTILYLNALGEMSFEEIGEKKILSRLVKEVLN